MKKRTLVFLSLLLVLALSGCGNGSTYKVKIVIPAGCREDFVFSQVEICPERMFDPYSQAGIHVKVDFRVPEDRGILLKDVQSGGSIYASHDTREVLLTKGTWYQIGIMGENPTDQDIQVSLLFENVKTRTSANAD